MFWFIIFTLTITFSVAYVIKRREDNAKRDVARDIKSEWYETNKIKRQ